MLIHTIKVFKILLKFDKKTMFTIAFLTIITALMPLVSIYWIQEMINFSVESDYSINSIAYYLIIFTFIKIFQYILGLILSYCNMQFSNTIVKEFNSVLLEKCDLISFEDFENSKIQNQIRRAFNSSNSVPQEIFYLIISLVGSLITLIGSVVYMGQWNVVLSILLVLIPFVFIRNYFKISKKQYEIDFAQTERGKENWYFTYLLTQDNAFVENKVNYFSKYLIDKYRVNMDKFKNDNNMMYKYQIKNTIVPEMFNIISMVLIIIYLIIDVKKGNIQVGNLVGIIQLTNMVFDGSQNISMIFVSLSKNNHFIQDIFAIMDIKDIVQNNIIIESIDSIRLKNVSYIYNDSNVKALKNINIEIKKGERFIIVGENGSGKSTFIKILSGLYKPTCGEILINDIEISKIDIQSYMKHISIMFQDYTQYEMTLKENIAISQIDKISSNKKIKELVSLMNLDRRVQDMSNGIDTNLGTWFSNSESISGGEWQKIGFMRTFFKEASIYILDEPTSSLDPLAYSKVNDIYRELIEDKIGLYITHTYRCIEPEDKIIFFKNGEIVGSDTHYNLLDENMDYKKIISEWEKAKEEVE